MLQSTLASNCINKDKPQPIHGLGHMGMECCGLEIESVLQGSILHVGFGRGVDYYVCTPQKFSEMEAPL